MRRIRAKAGEETPFSLSPEALVERASMTFGGLIRARGDVSHLCLMCDPAPCIAFLGDDGGVEVCPTSAITKSQDGTPDISEACIGCALCAARCPVGALSWVEDRISVAPPAVEGPGVVLGGSNDAAFDDIRRATTWSPGDFEELVARLSEQTRTLGQDAFYPLTERLFRAAGVDARLGRRGDTANRIDLTLICDGDAIPVEIKSPTESAQVNVKSVQQAIENKVVLTARRPFPSRRDSASLIVALEPPAPRSGVSELIVDAWDGFRISIGMITVPWLWRAAALACRGERPLEWSTLASARGLL